ncbi:MAG: ECF transporter S component [Oscillospiraceae bacterium]|nr:ECF transporter S component [Oscillospiraceae bacterium]
MTPVKRIVLAALCVALCVILPMAFHAVPDGGSIFLPMHIPVLICGLVCGWPYGFLCGLMGPALSSLMTMMPPAAYLPAMMVECGVYGLVSGLMLKFVHTRNTRLDLYLALVTAMIAGRVVSGIAKALIFNPGITFVYWITASFVTALPGIVIQLVLIPLLVSLLMKAKQIPARYPQGE